MKKIDLDDRLINYSVLAIRLTKEVKQCYAGQHLSKQLIRSTTSTALNFGEVRGAASKKDFIHKNTIVLKELRESQNNLKIIQKAELCNDKEKLNRILDESHQLISIFSATLIKLQKTA